MPACEQQQLHADDGKVAGRDSTEDSDYSHPRAVMDAFFMWGVPTPDGGGVMGKGWQSDIPHVDVAVSCQFLCDFKIRTTTKTVGNAHEVPRQWKHRQRRNTPCRRRSREVDYMFPIQGSAVQWDGCCSASGDKPHAGHGGAGMSKWEIERYHPNLAGL